MSSPHKRLPEPFFSLSNGELSLEGVPIRDIAETIGTPFYAYSAGRLCHRASTLKALLDPLNVSIYFSTKALSNIAILALFNQIGLGVDIVSGGELIRAKAAAIAPEHIIFSGVGKTEKELKQALDFGIYQINVESWAELETINRLAQTLKCQAPVALRINPNIDANTHKKITTGLKNNKFGIDASELSILSSLKHRLDHISLKGLSCHIGSQIVTPAPLYKAYNYLLSLADSLKSEGWPLDRLDLGGGFGISYKTDTDQELSFEVLADCIRQTVFERGYTLAIEPGRSLTADSGILVTSVILTKSNENTSIAVVDAAMNDLVRPSLYDAYHEVIPVSSGSDLKTKRYTIVGPICESSDILAHNRYLPLLTSGDLLAFATTGAYGATMSSFYNSRALIPEVLVKDGSFSVIRRRITIEDQLLWEQR